MSHTSQASPHRLPSACRARRVPEALWADAAAALVGPEAGDPVAAGRRLVQGASCVGIDLDLMFATFSGAEQACIGHVVLAVPGAGRTAMIFVSSLARTEDDHAHRVEALGAACRHLSEMGPAIQIAQALPEPEQAGIIDALAEAGFIRVATLEYLRRDLRRRDMVVRDPPALDDGVTIRPMRECEPGGADRAELARALERSYIDTLDCPELCGLREIEDVIDSHRAAGVWRPDLWWLVWRGGACEGCVLLSPTAEQDSVELVYLGLGPALRGRGLGRKLLERAIHAAAKTQAVSMMCAVDERNVAAMALYRRAGFRSMGSRVAFVRPFGATARDGMSAGASPQ